MSELTKVEEILLVTIWRLKDNAYGVKIRQHVSEVLKKEFTYGNLYSALDQLVKKNYVIKRVGEDTSSRRGRSRIYYTVSPEGLESLKTAREMNEALWNGISGYAFDK